MKAGEKKAGKIPTTRRRRTLVRKGKGESLCNRSAPRKGGEGTTEAVFRENGSRHAFGLRIYMPRYVFPQFSLPLPASDWLGLPKLYMLFLDLGSGIFFGHWNVPAMLGDLIPKCCSASREKYFNYIWIRSANPGFDKNASHGSRGC